MEPGLRCCLEGCGVLSLEVNTVPVPSDSVMVFIPEIFISRIDVHAVDTPVWLARNQSCEKPASKPR